MIKELQYIGVVDKLSQKGLVFHKRLLLLYANRLSYFSQVPAEAYTEDFDVGKALTLGLKQKSFVRVEHIISIAPIEDQILKKKKKRHMFVIQFRKEALNNFNENGVEINPKNKPVSWTFAIQQTEEYKKWLEVISLAKSRHRDIDSTKENIYAGTSDATGMKDKQVMIINDLDFNEENSSNDNVASKSSLGENKKFGNFDDTNIPDLQAEREVPKELPLAEVGTKRQRLSITDKQQLEQTAQRIVSPFDGKKKKHDAKVQKEIFRKRLEEDQKSSKESEMSEKSYRKAIMNEVFRGSWEAKFNVLLDKHLKCLDNFDELIDSEFKMLKFVKDFCSRAVDTCKSIVDELSRVPSERSHKAIQVTTLERDQEIPELVFMLNNCIIKMTWTVGGLEEISEAGEYYLYNEKTVKSYGNEFRAMNLLNECSYLVNRKYRNVIFRVPLSMVVDYKGFRCIVISSPPINGEETLVIGPSLNEGSYKINKNIEEDLKLIAQNMNLKEHKFPLEEKGTHVDVALSVLVEVHKTNMDLTEAETNQDGNSSYISQSVSDKKDLECYYLMNTAEIIPVDVDIDATTPASFLRRLRPEYVTSCNIPLSADAFISQSQTPDSQKDDFEVVQAGKALQQELIPKFIERLESLDILPFHSPSLTSAFHINGINIRYLGVICKKTNLPHIKGLCIQEMISRAAKKILRKQLSEMAIKEVQHDSTTSIMTHNTLEDLPLTKQMSSQQKKLEGARMEALIDFLNLLFGTGKESEKFWWGVLSKQVLYDYGYQMKRAQKSDVVYGGLLGSVAYHCNFKVALDEELEKSIGKTLNPFKKEHIRGFVAKPKMFRLEKLDIRKLEEKCKDAMESKHYDLAIKLCELLISSERVLSVEGKSTSELNYLEHLADIYLEQKDLEKAYEIAKETLQEFGDKEIDAVKFLTILMKINMMRNEGQLVEEIFYEIISYLDFHLGSYHPLHSTIYNMVGYYYVEKGQHNDALVLYRSSLVCLKKILGEDHVSTAEVLSELGHLLVKMGKNEEALEYYNKALNVYVQNKDQDRVETANICMEMAKILWTLGSLKDTMSVVFRALEYFEKNEEDHFENIVECSLIGMQVSEIVYDWEKTVEFVSKIWDILLQYEVENLGDAFDKITKTTLGCIIHTQSGEPKKILLNAFEALEKALVLSGELSLETVANGDDDMKRNLYSELLQAGKKGMELQNWFGATFEYLLEFLKSTPPEAFFNENYRQNIVEEGNEEIESSLRNFERLTRAIGTQFIYQSFHNN